LVCMYIESDSKTFLDELKPCKGLLPKACPCLECYRTTSLKTEKQHSCGAVYVAHECKQHVHMTAADTDNNSDPMVTVITTVTATQ